QFAQLVGGLVQPLRQTGNRLWRRPTGRRWPPQLRGAPRRELSTDRGEACLAPWQRYPAAVALAAGNAIKLKLDSLRGRQLRLNTLAQAAQAQGRYGHQPRSGGDGPASPLVERDTNYQTIRYPHADGISLGREETLHTLIARARGPIDRRAKANLWHPQTRKR